MSGQSAVGPSLRENTRQSQADMLNSYVAPKIGAVALGEVTPAVVQKLHGDLTDSGLGPRTVRYVHSVMRNMLGTAVTLQLMPQNPAAVGLKLPKQTRKEMRALSEEEARRLLEAARGDSLEAYYSLALAEDEAGAPPDPDPAAGGRRPSGSQAPPGRGADGRGAGLE